jgi:hypothetical protein
MTPQCQSLWSPGAVLGLSRPPRRGEPGHGGAAAAAVMGGVSLVPCTVGAPVPRCLLTTDLRADIYTGLAVVPVSWSVVWQS